MNVWANTVLTDQGRALMAKLTQGSTLNIKRAAVGEGFVTPGLLAKQTDVTDEVQELTFRPTSYPEAGKCAITVALSNEGQRRGYTATQVGLYAEDPDDGEILLFIAQATDTASGTIVPSETEMPGYSSDWTFYLQYGQADGVIVEVDPSNTVTKKYMEEYVVQVLERAGGKRTARFTIGTSTNGWLAKDCDYLCDGTADDAEINAAIAALPPTGGEVVLLDGAYNLAATIQLNKENVTLSGNGPSTSIRCSNSGIFCITVSEGGCTVRGLLINTNGSGITVQEGDYCRITDNIIQCGSDSGAYGISIVSPANRNFVSRNIVYGVVNGSSCGIYSSGNGSTITENHCIHHANGIHSAGGDAIIQGNSCEQNKTNNLYVEGSFNVVTNNDLCVITSDNYGTACALKATYLARANGIFANNVFGDGPYDVESHVNKAIAKTEDLTAGSSALETGTLYLVYE